MRTFVLVYIAVMISIFCVAMRLALVEDPRLSAIEQRLNVK